MVQRDCDSYKCQSYTHELSSTWVPTQALNSDGTNGHANMEGKGSQVLSLS